MKAILTRLTLIVAIISSLAVAASPAQAQVGAAATISIIDTSAFPDVRAYVAVQRSDKTGVPNLSKTDFQLLENGTAIPVTEVIPEDIGLQIAVMVDSTQTFATQDATANKLLNLVRDSITNFAIGDKTKNIKPQMKDGLDSISVFAPEGVIIQSSNVGGEVNNAMVSYQSKFQEQSQIFALTRQAISAVKTDPPGRVPRKHLVIFSAGLSDTNFQDVNDAITKSGVRGSLLVHTVLVSYDDSAGRLTREGENLQKIANATGGLFRRLYFVNAPTATQGLWETIASQRPQYRFTYRSRVTQSGQQSLQVILNFDGTVKSEPVPFTVTVLPPTVTFALPDVPADKPEIIRRGASLFAADTTAYEPREQKVLVQIKFPDGAKRAITKIRLLIDGTAVEEKTSAPFDVFNWNISKYPQTSGHTVQVIATDELGFEAKSDIENILITVSSPLVGNTGTTTLLFILIALGGITVVALMATMIVFIRRPMMINDVVRGAGQRVKEITEPFIPSPVGRRSASQISKAFLEVVDGFAEPKPPIDIIGDNLKLGRDATLAQIVLNDRSVSRLHARITEESDGIFHIHDEGSTSGTWVNYAQVPLTGQKLHNDDVINLGRIQLRFQLREAQPLPEPVEPAHPKLNTSAPHPNYSTEPFDASAIVPIQRSKPAAAKTAPSLKIAEDEHKTEAFTPPDFVKKSSGSDSTDQGIKQ